MAITPVKPADPLDLKRIAGQPTLGGPGEVLSANAEAVRWTCVCFPHKRKGSWARQGHPSSPRRRF